MPRPRREVQEIVEMHLRERDLQQEVFVEGLEDKRFYGTFLESQGLGRVAVLDVDTVDIPIERLAEFKLTEGKKNRVLALAALLEGKVRENQVVCIADADTDHFRGTTYPFSLLLITDYTSIELYALCPPVIERILKVGLQGFPKTPEQVVNELRLLLVDAFLVRVAAEDLALNHSYPKHSSFCSVDEKTGVVALNLDEYANKAFECNTDKNWRLKLKSHLEGLRKRLNPDPRYQMRGHDFQATFAWYVRQHKGYGNLNADTVSSLLLGFIDAETLRGELLFQEILRRLSRETA
jgi:hypothetical protein